ncbi:hypothetical protein D9758_003398 [Tetrapyrgos nigripes]|uniref:F-box domain-containing protein n=1 Tax=Tetrapyrgos nigripes TaxID=182062 RepID=A0A8H5GVQ1_9AGAR|nr:hypothetical protein D9758_003398 [Tetrapyrgos nigripes]
MRFREPYPSSMVISQMQQQLKDGENLFNDCDSEIQRLRSAISSLEEGKNHISSRMEDYRSYMSLVGKMPFELWAQVFVLSLPDCHGLIIDDDKMWAAALDLSHVCSFWRAIAISTPKLWSDLVIQFGQRSSDAGVPDVVALYLQRSEASPICFRLIISEQFGTDLDPGGWGLLTRLLEASSRWLHAHVAIPSIADHDRVNSIVQTLQPHFDILQTLTFRTGPDGPPKAPLLFSAMAAAPGLWKLDLEEFYEDYRQPFSQLREIIVLQLDGDLVLDCLSLCPELEQADITILDLEDDEIDSARRLCLPQLFSFICHIEDNPEDDPENDPSNGQRLFRALTLPALSRLEFSLDSEQRDEEARALSNSLNDLFTRSNFPLVSLNFGVALSDQELIHLLSLIPTLMFLELRSLDTRGFTASFFQRLIIPQASEIQGSPVIMPQLEFLVFHVDQDCSQNTSLYAPSGLPDPQLILTMIQSRRRPGLRDFEIRTLEEFSLNVHYVFESLPVPEERIISTSHLRTWADSFSLNVVPALRVMAEDGLHLKLELKPETDTMGRRLGLPEEVTQSEQGFGLGGHGFGMLSWQGWQPGQRSGSVLGQGFGQAGPQPTQQTYYYYPNYATYGNLLNSAGGST